MRLWPLGAQSALSPSAILVLFNPSTVISVSFSEKSEYKLTIVNSLGQIVDVFSGSADPGILDIKWDATGLASGIYFYKIEAGDFIATKKAVLLK